MLQLPDTGLSRSVSKHNSDLGVLCDWVEASALFLDERLSRSDIVEALLEGEVYADEEFAGQGAELALQHVGRRLAWLGASSPLVRKGDGLGRAKQWYEVPAHSFCLLVSLRGRYKAVSRLLGSNYGPQGNLFEELASDSLRQWGWRVHRVGWSSLSTENHFAEAVEQIADRLNETSNGGKVANSVKDAGLDLICWRPFPDAMGGHPFFLVQCGSGAHWEDKLGKPHLEEWRYLIRFTIPPMRALATPFAFPDADSFRDFRLKAEGLLLDRYRLLSVGEKQADWVRPSLQRDLISWLAPALVALPSLDESIGVPMPKRGRGKGRVPTKPSTKRPKG